MSRADSDLRETCPEPRGVPWKSRLCPSCQREARDRRSIRGGGASAVRRATAFSGRVASCCPADTAGDPTLTMATPPAIEQVVAPRGPRGARARDAPASGGFIQFFWRRAAGPIPPAGSPLAPPDVVSAMNRLPPSEFRAENYSGKNCAGCAELGRSVARFGPSSVSRSFSGSSRSSSPWKTACMVHPFRISGRCLADSSRDFRVLISNCYSRVHDFAQLDGVTPDGKKTSSESARAETYWQMAFGRRQAASRIIAYMFALDGWLHSARPNDAAAWARAFAPTSNRPCRVRLE